MDEYQRVKTKYTGIAGFKCQCCNFFRGFKKNGKPRYNRLARRKLKQELQKDK